jgi:hypothetical protein
VDEGRGEGRGGKAIISEAQELNVHHLWALGMRKTHLWAQVKYISATLFGWRGGDN